MPWDSTEAEHREAFVIVVRLDNTAHICESWLVLVVASKIVKRLRIAWLSVWSRVVDSTNHGNRPAGAKIVNERRSHVDTKVVNNESSTVTCLQSSLAAHQLTDSRNALVESNTAYAADESKLYSGIFVGIAKLTKWNDLLLHSEVWSVKLARNLHSNCKVLRVWNLPVYDAGIVSSLSAHAHASSCEVLHILPAQAPFGHFVWLLHRLRPDNDLAAVCRVALIREIGCESLFLSAHELAHCDLNFTDCIVVTATVAINHDKLEILHLLKEVRQLEGVLKVRIQVVLDLLRLTEFDPGPIGVLFIEYALGIWLAERVQIFKFTTWHEQVHLHRKVLRLNHFKFNESLNNY